MQVMISDPKASGELQVKGSSLSSKLLFVQDVFGPEAHQELRSALADWEGRQILDGSWYPFELYDKLLRFIAERHYQGDLSRLVEVGIYSAESSLKTTYQVYTLRDFFYLLDRLGTLHSRFYSIGELENSVDTDQRQCRIRLHGAPYYREPDLYVASGFYIGAARMMGLGGVECDFRMVGSEVVFDLRWQD